VLFDHLNRSFISLKKVAFPVCQEAKCHSKTNHRVFRNESSLFRIYRNDFEYVKMQKMSSQCPQSL